MAAHARAAQAGQALRGHGDRLGLVPPDAVDHASGSGPAALGQDPGEAGVARGAGVQCLVAERLGPRPGHVLGADADEPPDRAQRAALGAEGVRAVDAERVEVAVLVPGGAVRTGVARQRRPVHGEAPVQAQLEAERDAEDAGAVRQEREVERRAVPGGDDAGGQAGEAVVERGEDVGLVADVELLEATGGQGDGAHGRDGRVEAVLRVVRLDVEPVDRCLMNHPSSRTTHSPVEKIVGGWRARVVDASRAARTAGQRGRERSRPAGGIGSGSSARGRRDQAGVSALP
ncbi:MAG: hypothetical protein U0P45_01300 [Acidimicrobiales bacterium]